MNKNPKKKSTLKQRLKLPLKNNDVIYQKIIFSNSTIIHVIQIIDSNTVFQSLVIYLN